MGDLTIAEVLERAADLIEPEGAWTQGAFSRDANGDADATDDGITAKNPVCWCALGAVAAVCEEDPAGNIYTPSSPSLPNAIRKLLNAHIGNYVEDWNDDPDRTQAEVVQKLREAARLARTQDNGSL